VLRIILAGQTILGAWPSVTVTVKEQTAELPAASVAFHATFVVPIGNCKPLAVLAALVRVSEAVQLSENEGSA
jgi:hypothetical protein